jgi:hypothetical protein
MNGFNNNNLSDSLFEIMSLMSELNYFDLSKEDANLLNELVPDVIVRGLDGGDRVLNGDAFLYGTLPGSGLYTFSWQPGDPNDGKITFGVTSFLINKTVVYDDNNIRIGVMTEPTGNYSINDYSENGDVVEMSAPGGKSNLFGVAAFLREIELQ